MAGGCRYHGFLPDTEAALVNATLEQLADRAGPDPATGLWEPQQARLADALVDLARHHSASATVAGSDPNLVVIHTPAAVLDGTEPGNGTVGAVPVPAASVLRLLCDTTIQYQLEGPNGTCVGVGRTQRTIPRWLRRLILHRDHTCRFPGCTRPIRHVHHLIPWSQGGVTDSWNLTGLCWTHHHLVHEGHWNITGDANTALTFTSPYGRTLTGRLPPLRPEIHRRLTRTLHLPSPNPGPRPPAGPAP